MLQDVFGLLPASKAGHVHECIVPMLLRSRGAQACDACTAKPGQQWLSSLPLHMASCVLYACWMTRAVQQDQKDSHGVPAESSKSCCSIKSQAHLVMKADITPNLCWVDMCEAVPRPLTLQSAAAAGVAPIDESRPCEAGNHTHQHWHANIYSKRTQHARCT